MFDETGWITSCREPVIHLPTFGRVIARVIEHDGPDSSGALQVREEKGAIVGDNLGDSFDLTDLEDGRPQIGDVLPTIRDERGHAPCGKEKNSDEGDSCQHRCHGTGQGGTQAEASHLSIVVVSWLKRLTA